MKKRKTKKYKIILFIAFSFLVLLFIVRLISPREIDDISPGIKCDKSYLEKADVLWVIPLYNNTKISENKTWCEEILALNKTLGLHGIYHSYHEFDYFVNETELLEAIKIFEECFNETPTRFKAPYLKISDENKFLLEKNNLKLRGIFSQNIHKVYHCVDTGVFPNSFHDIF